MLELHGEVARRCSVRDARLKRLKAVLRCLVIQSRGSLSISQRLLVRAQILDELGVIAPLLEPLLPAVIPVRGFDTQENANDDDGRINRRGDPIVIPKVLLHSPQPMCRHVQSPGQLSTRPRKPSNQCQLSTHSRR